MELPEQIQTFRDFLEVNEVYLRELHEQVRKGNAWFTVQFADLARHNPELAELLLEEPEDVLKAFQIAIDKMDLPRASEAAAPKIEPRIINLPPQQSIEIRNVRSKHLNRFVQLIGVVRQKSDVRPQMTSARFECPACGNIIPVLQIDQKFQEPSRCGCGRKGKFKLLTKELVDAQSITLEEAPEDLDGGEQPKRLKLFLKNDLVSPLTDKRTNPGSKITVVGVIKEVPIILQTGGQSTRFDLILEANALESIQEDFTEINITPEQEKDIRELSQDPDLFEKLVSSIAPNIYGHEPIKQALLLQMFGGVHKARDKGIKSRGDIHMLLIGDPGSGKSVLLKRVSAIAPKARFVSGKGASGAGLCVAPNSIILTNPGGMETIERVVEDRLNAPVPVNKDVWKQEHITDVKIQSLSHDLKLQSQHPAAIWKLKAPKTVFVVTLTSGKRIELTGNTQLLTLQDGTPTWKRSAEITVGEHIATPRTLVTGDQDRTPVVDLITSNPVVHDVKPFVRTLVTALAKKHGGIRAVATHLGVKENQLYHHWTNEAARGNIKLRSLARLGEAAEIDWKPHVQKVSLYNGKPHLLPQHIDAETLYIAGLIAGDGDIRKSGSTWSIRFSNENATLREMVKDVFEKKFGLHTDTQPGSVKRPPAIRTHSTILAELLFALGIPASPKSYRIALSNTLLHATNPLLASFIAGLYDADGSVSQRRTRGSNTVDLTTCSETLARQVQLILVRFGMHARIRTRRPSTGKIVGRHTKWIVEIRSREQFQLFEQHIPLRHEKKRTALQTLTRQETQGNTNVDIIPGIDKQLRTLLQRHHLPVKRAKGQQYSRKGLQHALAQLPSTRETRELRELANSDIFWDCVKSVDEKEAPYEFVYDLTVQDAHNFVVDGVLVHNTAAVVKDDFLKGWALEAGALVLANRGLCCIDELDKMTDEDTSAMHEALEQQCLEYNTPILFADGSERKIGEYVEELFEKYPEHIIEGHDCFLLKDGIVRESLLTTDWKTVSQTKITRVSKHITTENLYKIMFTNGRSITVTPEHPVFVMENGHIITKRADRVVVGNSVPVPRTLPIAGAIQHFSTTQADVYNPRATQHIAVPEHNDAFLYRLVGYLLSEGSKERNRGKLIGINFTNKDAVLLDDFRNCVEHVFQVPCYAQQRIDEHEPRTMLRYISRELAVFFEREMPELLNLASSKQIPEKLMKGRRDDIAQMLLALFEGDGHVAVKTRTLRIGYGTNSRKMAEQIQDLLLRFGIMSSVTHFKGTNKVNVTGYENIRKFNEHIGFLNPIRKKKVVEYLHAKSPIRTYKDVIPVDGNTLVNILKKNHIRFIGKTNIYMLKYQWLRKNQAISRLQLQKLVTVLQNKKVTNDEKKYVEFLNNMAFGQIGFEKIKSVEIIKATHPWTYDVTIEPTHTFISQAAILHNTISISKANIQATLRCETTVLAAANPKFGRFDPYEIISKQIELPPALLSRFDLIFPVRDLPDKAKDEKLASFILNRHKENLEVHEIITPERMRSYIAYARQTCHPRLTDAAILEIKEYYVKMRGGEDNPQTEVALKPIPITARQLEALIRLAEASAKMRLSDRVTKRDAQVAIELVHYCLQQIGMDPETGKIDLDRVTSGIGASQRSHIQIVKELVKELEERVGKAIPIEEIVREAGIRGVADSTTEDVIEKLKRSGDVYSPKHGFISRT